MQHSEQAASVVRVCYFPAGFRCVCVGGGGGWDPTCRAENTDPRCDSLEDCIKAPQTFSFSLSVFKNIAQTACTASKSHPRTSSSCLTSITVNYLSPRHWHLLSSEGKCRWISFASGSWEFEQGLGVTLCEFLAPGLSHSSSSSHGSCTSWFGIFQSSSSTLLFFWPSSPPSSLCEHCRAVESLSCGGCSRGKVWCQAGGKEGRKERRKERRDKGKEWNEEGACNKPSPSQRV